MVVAADNAPANQPVDMKNTFQRQVVVQKVVDLLHATVLAEHRAAPIATTSACQSFALTGVDLNSLQA